MKKSLLFKGFLLALFMISFNQSKSQYIVNFEGEGEEKPSYATASVILSGLTWEMTESLIGNLDNDWKNGLKSARLRGYAASSMTMTEDKSNGIGSISFYYRRYGTDGQVDWKVEYSSDAGNTWTQIGAAFTAPSSDDVQLFDEVVNAPGDVRIRIKRATEDGSANRRLNIDDITVTDFSGGGNIPPTITNISQTPSIDITSSTSVAVSAEITDNDGTVTLAQLKWGTTAGTFPNTIPMSNTGGTTYTTSSNIPAQNNGTTVYYVVYAEDNDGGNKTSPVQTYIVKDAATTTLPYSENFESGLGDVYTYSLSGDTKYWLHSSSGYVYMNGFNTGELEDDWLILPGFNADTYSNVSLNFDTWKRFGFEDDENYFKLYYSTDYEGLGNPLLASWTELPYNQPAEEQVWENSGMIDLNTIEGELIYVAFRYHYNTGAYRLWQVDNIQISGVESNVITLWRFDIDGDLTPSAGEGIASLVGGVTEVSQDNALRITDFPNQSTASGSAGIQLMLSTAGYQNIQLSFRHRSSGTMSRYAQVQYTTNGGSTWIPFQDNNGGLSPHDTYYDFSFDLSSLPEVANNPNFGLRIVSIFSPVAFDDGLGNSFGANEAYHRARISGGDPYSGSGNWRFQDVSITGDVITGNIPTRLAVVNVNNGVNPTIGNPFSITVQSQDENNSPANVLGNTTVVLSVGNGSGILGGTINKTIVAGSNTVVFDNLTYSLAENGVTISAAATSGMALTSGSSAPFNVLAVATQLAFNNFPSTGQLGLPITSFELQAQRPDGTVDEAYSGSVILSKASGPGNITGTLTKNFSNGTAIFDDISFDASGNYTLSAQSTGLTSAVSPVIYIAAQPEIIGEIVPQYIQGINGTNATRLPFAFWVNIGNLIPNATYRYINQVVTEGDGPTTNGAGNIIYTHPSGNFYRTSSPSFSVDGAYGTFTADVNGQFSGWFITEPSGNARFTPGNEVFFRIRINDGNDGTTAVNYLTTNTAATVINFGSESNDVQGTGIRATSASSPKNFVFLFDNATGSGRPLYATTIETIGIDYNASTTWAEFYRNEVASVDGSWGGIVPNVNAAGIRRIEERSFTNGSIVETFSSDNGIWGATDTRNPTGGIDNILVLNLNLTNDPMLTVSPSVLNGFIYVEGSGPSQILSYTISGEFLDGSGNINVAAPTDYEISINGIDFTQSLNLPFANGAITGQPVSVSVRLKAGLNPGVYNNQIIVNSGGGATAKNITLNGEVTSLVVPEITAELVPQFIQGTNGTNSTRLPFAFWVEISGLQPGLTYRYINQVVTSSDGPTTNGAGNVIYVEFDGNYSRTSSPGFVEPGSYGEFTANTQGMFSGWFMTEPTGNVRFTPGNEVLFRIRINDGNNGTTASHWLTTSSFAKVINFGNGASENEGTAIRATSADEAKSIVMLYDNFAGSGRPVYATSIEITGVDYAGAGTYAGFYTDQVFGNNGAWGGIVPNINSNGIRNISLVNPLSGYEKTYQSSDGIWGDLDTRNPVGGISEVLYLDLIVIGNVENTLENTHISLMDNQIHIDNFRNETLVFEAFNLMGQQVLTRNIVPNSSMIIGHHFTSGGYIVRLHNGRNQSVKKIVVK